LLPTFGVGGITEGERGQPDRRVLIALIGLGVAIEELLDASWSAAWREGAGGQGGTHGPRDRRAMNPRGPGRGVSRNDRHMGLMSNRHAGAPCCAASDSAECCADDWRVGLLGGRHNLLPGHHRPPSGREGLSTRLRNERSASRGFSAGRAASTGTAGCRAGTRIGNPGALMPRRGTCNMGRGRS